MWVMAQTYTTTADEVIGMIPVGYADEPDREICWAFPCYCGWPVSVLLLGVCLIRHVHLPILSGPRS